MKGEKKQIILAELIQKELDGCLTDQEFNLLQSMLKEDKEAVQYYVKTMRAISAFYANSIDPSLQSVEEGSLQVEPFQSGIWKALADAEKDAPAIKITDTEEPKILIQKIRHEKVVRKISKSSLFSLFAAAAAIILIFVFAHFAPPETGFKVAVLSDSIHAKWAEMDGAMEKGVPILTSRENLLLREGYAELLFDNNVRITLEGPAEFQIFTDDQIKMQYGRLYAIVPQEAIGFTITTQTAKIIDLGTEFGIETAASGDTQLHVMKGRTTLIAGEKSHKVSMEVGQGLAKKVSALTSIISDIPCNATFFVREINSKNDTVWRGQKQINLADIVGGGNGLGTGKIDMGIDPISGKLSKDLRETRKSENDYHPVPSNPYIDGVFVPNGRTQQIVSSQGHLFGECPATSGSCSQNIISSAVRSLDSRIDQNTKVSDSPAHSLLLHSNIGITFDLQAIRKLLPGIKIIRFQSKFGIRKWAIHPGASNADFWVLVDGKLRYERRQVKINELNSVDIELSEQDRFLTLIETDGGDPEGRIMDGSVLSPNDSDWGIFVDPILVLK